MVIIISFDGPVIKLRDVAVALEFAQREDEFAALSEFAFHPHFSFMFLNKILADIQPQSGTPFPAGAVGCKC